MARINSYEQDTNLTGNEQLLGTDPNDSSKTKNFPLTTLKTYFGGGSSSNYKVYSALLTQTGTNNPVVTVLENTIGNIVWTRSATGIFLGTLTGTFTINKTQVFFNAGNVSLGTISLGENFNGDIIRIRTMIGSTLTDGLMASASLEIKVYN